MRSQDWTSHPIQAGYVDDERMKYRLTIIKPGWITLFVLFMLIVNVQVWFVGWVVGHFTQTGLTSNTVSMEIKW